MSVSVRQCLPQGRNLEPAHSRMRPIIAFEEEPQRRKAEGVEGGYWPQNRGRIA